MIKRLAENKWMRIAALTVVSLFFVSALFFNFFHTHSILEDDDHCPVYLLGQILAALIIVTFSYAFYISTIEFVSRSISVAGLRKSFASFFRRAPPALPLFIS